MKQTMKERSANHNFLLDDDSTLPFDASGILEQTDDKVRDVGALGPLMKLACLLLHMQTDN
jgi:hypothetical protein